MQDTLDAVVASFSELEGCLTATEFADRAIDLLWDLIPCSDLSFNELDESNRRVDLFRWRSEVTCEQPSDEGFWEYEAELPICWGLAPGAAGVTRTQDVISRRALLDTRIYAEVLHPDGIEHEMKMAFESPPWISRAFLFARPDRAFTDREAERAQVLAPYLAAVYRRVRVSSTLTMREREVLDLVARGLTNPEVAASLGITPGTVRAHLEHAFSKLRVNTRTGAVAAIR